VFRKLGEEGIADQRHRSTLKGFFETKYMRMKTITPFFLRFVFVIPFLFAFSMWGNRRVRFAAFVFLLLFIIALLQKQTVPRKLAPVTCLITFLTVAGLRRISLMRRVKNSMRMPLACTVLAVCVLSVLATFSGFFQNNRSIFHIFAQKRSNLIAKLSQQPGKDLVIVRYGPNHLPLFELVYNEADIDGSEVIFARELAPSKMPGLLDYYRGRTMWLLDGDSWMAQQWRMINIKPPPRK
jgi:hypothetical protein